MLVLLVFILLLTNSLGYIPGLPYILYNTGILFIPVLWLLMIKKIIYTRNELFFSLIWLFLNSFSLSLSIHEMFPDSTTTHYFIIMLRAFDAVLIYSIAKNTTLPYDKLATILVALVVVQFSLMSYQFFIQDRMVLLGAGEQAKWVKAVNPPVFWKLRVQGLHGNSNTSAFFLLVSFIIILPYILRKRFQLFIIFILSAVAIVIYAKSRSTMLVSFFYILFYVFIITKKKKHLRTLFIGAFIGMLFLSFLSADFFDSILRLNNLQKDTNNLTIRQWVNRDAFNIWWQELTWIGGGLNSEVFFMTKFNAYRPYSEMAYLKILIEIGFVGLLFILFTILKITQAIPENSFIMKSLIFVFFFVSFLETAFFTQQFFYFSIFIFSYFSHHKVNITTSFLLKK